MRITVVLVVDPSKGAQAAQHIQEICNPFAVKGLAHGPGKDPYQYNVEVADEAEALKLMLDLWKAKAWETLRLTPRVIFE